MAIVKSANLIHWCLMSLVCDVASMGSDQKMDWSIIWFSTDDNKENIGYNMM